MLGNEGFHCIELNAGFGVLNACQSRKIAICIVHSHVPDCCGRLTVTAGVASTPALSRGHEAWEKLCIKL